MTIKPFSAEMMGIVIAAVCATPLTLMAQTQTATPQVGQAIPTQAPATQPGSPASVGASPVYKPPLKGAPGGRVGGASRGSEGAGLPTIEPLAPDEIAGQTVNPSPTLYFFVSRPAPQPLVFTISAANVVRPLVEKSLPGSASAGIQAVRLSDLAVQLQPGVNYTWSVALVIDPLARSKDIVARASIVRVASDPGADNAARGAAPLGRAAVLAQAGLWYDALTAAAEGEPSDRHAAFDALLDQIGLSDAAQFDRQQVAVLGTR